MTTDPSRIIKTARNNIGGNRLGISIHSFVGMGLGKDSTIESNCYHTEGSKFNAS